MQTYRTLDNTALELLDLTMTAYGLAKNEDVQEEAKELLLKHGVIEKDKDEFESIIEFYKFLTFRKVLPAGIM